MAIKTKTGECIDCGKDRPLCAKRCEWCYKAYRAKVNAQKPKKQAKNQPIAKKSVNQIDREIEYAKKRKVWLPLHPKCEANLNRCQGPANQVHHMQGRSGELLMNSDKWLAVCHNCHTWITEHSAESIEMGLSLRRNS